ncbi:helix-turn-helix domain-containing protein [Marinigracilibium pacificum]|uniref:AraC family transcriptional regulator n=1 Tax=Marinigracilibium pacificum TaxID=2729599 RepID=A0A848J2M6_9BACT|nr:helix-turn-helix domain-containing protein [Marinigracilibium pacificum]NMM50847.1 AraC family transcriptional regulator [Marinigracilibium pacificum]
MDYQTYQPHSDLEAIIKCYWTLEVPANPNTPKQRIIPDGCIEMCFILGEDIRRFTSENEYIIQPRTMVFGQITKPYYIQPTGYVNTFAVRFYPYGFANFISSPISELADKETPLTSLFDKDAVNQLEQQIITASSTKERIETIEIFLLNKLTSQLTIDNIVKSTIDTLLNTKGNKSINSILKNEPSKRRSLERKFSKQVGISPKQLGRIIRLQAALKLMLANKSEKLTQIAYDSEYYDQAHFIKDFKDFTGKKPTEYLGDEEMTLSSLIYSND